MARWLLKTEPDEFSYADLVARGAAGEPWTGVRNHQARNLLRQMQEGDLALVYHTGAQKQAVGICRIARTVYPDPTDPAWESVDVVAHAGLVRPVTLATVKADPALADMSLVRQARLSVQPVTDAAWSRILELSGGLRTLDNMTGG
jgi:predicted RNA-binding protein with PUA-like domain